MSGRANGLNDLARRQWQWVEDMGWHNKRPLEYLALISSEVGEAVNECRGEEPSAHLAEELADVFLRVADMAAEFDIDLESAVLQKMEKNERNGTRGRSK